MEGATSDQPARRARGRPREIAPAAREAAILDAAERLLVTGGLHATTMAAIAAEAGMSKRTVYTVFAGRAELFEACIRRIRTSLIRPLRPEERDLPLPERLARIFRPEARNADFRVPLAVLRAVVIEAPRHPDLGRAFLREGPDRGRAIVRDELTRAAATGAIAVADLDMAARVLCDMVFESPVERLIDSARADRAPAEADRRREFAIRTFLRGVG